MERLIFLTVVASSLLFHSFSLSAASDLDDLCWELQGDYITYPACQEAFGQDPRSSTASYHELAVIIIDVTIERTTSLRNKLGALLKSEKDPKIKSVIQSCAKYYSDDFPLLKRARDFAAAQNFGNAAHLLSELGNAAQACIEASNAKRVSVEVAAKDSSYLSNLALVANTVNEVVAGK